jgi:hypothetical protein
MKKGFEFLITEREDISNIQLDFRLPELYLEFISTFKLGEDGLAIDKYLDSDGELSQLGTIVFNCEHGKCYLNKLNTLQGILEEFEYGQLDDEWKTHKLLRIGQLGQAGFGGLYLGCNDFNKDEIWVFNADQKKQYIKIAPNIFAFVSLLEFSFDFSDLPVHRYNDLTKRWGEEFWRIR